MQIIYHIESLEDVRELQNPNRKPADPVPCIGSVVIDLVGMKIEFSDKTVTHNYTIQKFIEALATAAHVKVKVR